MLWHDLHQKSANQKPFYRIQLAGTRWRRRRLPLLRYQIQRAGRDKNPAKRAQALFLPRSRGAKKGAAVQRVSDDSKGPENR